MGRSTGKDSIAMISKVFFRLFPVQVAIVAMGSINSIVDGIIAGRFIDAGTVGVVGLYYTVVRILEAAGAVLLGGVAVLSGRYLGSGKLDKTRGICSLGFSMALFIGMILTILSFAAPQTIARLLGADADLCGPLATYIVGYGIGIIPQLLAQQLAASLQLERKEKLTQVGVFVMISCNVGLDILLVAVLNMGIWGLALATSIANWAYFLVLGAYYLSPKAQLRPSLKKASWKENGAMILIGLPNAILVACLAARSLIVNRVLLANAGQDGLSALSAFNMVSGLAIAVALGAGAVVRMLSSVFMGEENREGILSLLKIALTRVMLLIIALSVVFLLLAPVVAGVFFPDRTSEVYAMTRQLISIYSLCIPLCYLNIVFSNHCQAFGYGRFVNTISVMDGLLSVAVPSLILAPVLGALGVWISFPIGIVLTTLYCIVSIAVILKHRPRGLSQWFMLPPEFGSGESLVLDIHDIKDVTQTASSVEKYCADHGITGRTGTYAALCLEEIAGNIVNHGFGADRMKHHIEVRVVIMDTCVVLRIKDDCIPFNPKEWYDMVSAKKDPTANIGIRLVYGLAKVVFYQNLLGLNVLTIKLEQ